MNPQIIITLVIAACGFGSAWTIQDWRMDAKEAQYAKQKLADQQLAAATQVRRLDNTLAAENSRVLRDVALRNDAFAARSSLIGLHDASAAALLASGASLAACTERAAAFVELLGTMATAGGSVAEKADRHANDAQTLIDAWPK